MQLGMNARAALITRGLAEMTRLGVAMGARADTFMGLSGLGDLVLTATGDLSRNRQVGLALAQGQSAVVPFALFVPHATIPIFGLAPRFAVQSIFHLSPSNSHRCVNSMSPTKNSGWMQRLRRFPDAFAFAKVLVALLRRSCAISGPPIRLKLMIPRRRPTREKPEPAASTRWRG
jgi:hypothetical protein